MSPLSQPVHQHHYSRIASQFNTPIPSLVIDNLDSIFPWDRATNYTPLKLIATAISDDNSFYQNLKRLAIDLLEYKFYQLHQALVQRNELFDCNREY